MNFYYIFHLIPQYYFQCNECQHKHHNPQQKMPVFVKATLYPENTPIAIRRDTITTIVHWPPKEDESKGTWNVYVSDPISNVVRFWTITHDSGWVLYNTINDK